jgi:hypothetical protein
MLGVGGRTPTPVSLLVGAADPTTDIIVSSSWGLSLTFLQNVHMYHGSAASESEHTHNYRFLHD